MVMSKIFRLWNDTIILLVRSQRRSCKNTLIDDVAGPMVWTQEAERGFDYR